MLKHKGKSTLTGICHVLHMALSYRRTHPILQTEAPFGGGVAENLCSSFLVRNIQNGLLWLFSLYVAGLSLRVQLWMRPWHTVLLRCFCLKAVYVQWLCALFAQYGLFVCVIIRDGIIQQFIVEWERKQLLKFRSQITHVLSTVTVTHATGHWRLYVCTPSYE